MPAPNSIAAHPRRTLLTVIALIAMFTLPGWLGTPASAGLQDDGLRFEVTSGPDAGATFPADEPYWTIPVWSLSDGDLQGPVVYGGYGCVADRPSMPKRSSAGAIGDGEHAILVLQRGPTSDPDHPGGACLLGEKVESAILAGWDAVLIANDHAGSGGGTNADATYCGPPGKAFAPNATAVCVGHGAMHAMFGTEPVYTGGSDGAQEPEIGQVGERLSATSLGMPVAWSKSVLGPGWASFAVSSPGGRVKFPLRLDGDASFGQLNAFLYGADDEFLGGFGFGVIRSEASYWGTVKAGPIDFSAGEPVLVERTGAMTMTAEVNTTGPTVFKMLVWGGGRNVASFQAGLRGDGIELLGTETGTSSVVAMAREFEAPVNIEAHGHAGGRATVLGEKVLEVKDTLIGSFSQMSMTASHTPPWTGVNANAITATTPSGEQICHPFGCSFKAATGATRMGPGTYRFKVSGAGAGISGSDDVMLNVVDARLPAIS